MAGAMQGWFENVDPETRALLLQFLLEAAGSTERAKDAAELALLEPQFTDAADPLQAADYFERSADGMHWAAANLTARAERLKLIAARLRTQFG
jgi:hypothetical protein